MPVIGGESMEFTYGDLQAEMDQINRAYIDVMTAGDAKGRVFTFPIPTYNITPDFPWDSENADRLFEMTARKRARASPICSPAAWLAICGRPCTPRCWIRRPSRA